MLKYFFGRVLLVIPTFVIALVIIFFLIRLIPGDPAQLMLGTLDDPEALARIREKLALDQPITIQFLNWIAQMAKGDFGTSISQQSPVLDLIIPSFGVTASLVLPAVALASLIAIPAGAISAWKQNTKSDTLIITLATIALSIPSFWLGLMFLLFFGVKLDLFPVVGYISLQENFQDGINYLVLPVISLALIEAGVLVRLMRSSTVDISRLEYITHARAKGANESRVLWRHALPNAMAPTWTMIGLTLGSLLGGAVVTETVFSLPGMGRLMVESIFARDYPVIQGCMVFIIMAYVCVNLIIDATYPLFSPGVVYE